MPGARFAPIYVDDVVRAIIRVATDADTAGQTYQLCGPEVYSLRELVNMIGKTIGVRRWIWGLPGWLSRAQATIMDYVPGKPFSTDNYHSLTVHSICTENGMERLAIRPRSLEGLLEECVAELNSRSALDNFRQLAGR
jgi:NADH dehydrogenase